MPTPTTSRKRKQSNIVARVWQDIFLNSRTNVQYLRFVFKTSQSGTCNGQHIDLAVARAHAVFIGFAALQEIKTGAALRNIFKRYTGLRTTEVRQNGGERCLVHAFKRELAAVSAGKPPIG